MSDDHNRLLEEIGFTSENLPTTHWLKMYSELVEYKKVHGHCDVPVNLKEKQKLLNWLLLQRSFYRNGNLSNECIELFDKIGFNWY